MSPPTTTVSRKRTRSTNLADDNHDSEPSTSALVSSLPTNPAPPKRQRNNSSESESHSSYSLRNRSVTSDSQRYNLRPRRSQTQAQLPPSSTAQPVAVPRRARRQTPSTAPPTSNPPHELPPSTDVPSRQYRLVYISDEDDEQPTSTAASSATIVNLVTDNETIAPRRTARSTSNTTHNTRSRAATDPASTSRTDTSDFPTDTVRHVHLNRAIEIVIDSIQSLEGAVNNFDHLVFSLIYGRWNTRTEFESLEGMVRLSRILNLNFPSRLSQDEIDALPKIKFLNKSESASSVLLAEKCPICLTEFTDEEIINKLHCTHLFHPQCISTWLSENDSCPTCRRQVNG